ncbi:MAG TPA: phosphatidate cytidylyltransferase [Candidatus Limnocylindria bacterium]|nr:phosphatidate cytidylyltransferase [Candidatus Limnocylindria bacterium]
MRQRLISAAVLVAVVVAFFVAGNPWLTIGIAVLAALAAYEAADLVRAAGLPADRWLAALIAAGAVLGLPLLTGPGSIELGAVLVAPALAAGLMLTAVVALRQRNARDGFLGWAGTTIAALYPAMLAFAAAIVALGGGQAAAPLPFGLDAGRVWLAVLVLTVWTLDSAAYLAGRYHGRGRFFNHVSPHKTWSGAIGGTLAAIAACAGLVVLAGGAPLGGAILGLIIALTAQAGDLAESMLKRAAGAKDSGRLIPGHGGILDRVDSYIFAAPAAWLLIAYFGLG